jgi:hypothetical protein
MGSIVNLSAGGACIMVEGQHALEVGDVTQLGLTQWAATATIRHIRAGDADGRFYYGVELSEVDAEFRGFVTEYLAAFTKLTDPPA